MTLTVTRNDDNTININDEDGQLIGRSGVFRRRRSFDNLLTGESVWAKDFTPRKVKAEPSKVLGYLLATGLNVFDAAEVVIAL